MPFSFLPLVMGRQLFRKSLLPPLANGIKPLEKDLLPRKKFFPLTSIMDGLCNLGKQTGSHKRLYSFVVVVVVFQAKLSFSIYLLSSLCIWYGCCCIVVLRPR